MYCYCNAVMNPFSLVEIPIFGVDTIFVKVYVLRTTVMGKPAVACSCYAFAIWPGRCALDLELRKRQHEQDQHCTQHTPGGGSGF